MNNYALDGGGVMAIDGDPIVRNCSFINNEADFGGGMFYNNYAHPAISGCIFYGNFADEAGGAIFAETGTSMIITNCTITHNDALSGGGIEIRAADIELVNSIISFNRYSEALTVRGIPRIIIEYSDIFGNWGGDWTGPIEEMLGQNGNISADPIFADSANADFHLTLGSPCIDAGDPTWPYDPDGTIADMGAYYYDQTVAIDYTGIGIPELFRLVPNYPNPFNVSTVISYDLTRQCEISLEIYDLLGRRIRTVSDGILPAGGHSVIWNAEGFASGIYICKLTVDGFSQSRKMTLVK